MSDLNKDLESMVGDMGVNFVSEPNENNEPVEQSQETPVEAVQESVQQDVQEPVQQSQAIVVGDFVTITYDCIIQTYYMEQLNGVIEAIEYASDSYWGNPERYKFRAFIDNFGSTTELTDGQERLVRGNFTIRLRGQIIPEVLQKDLNALKAFNSKAKVTVTTETVQNISTLE